ncbi:MAG: hypothetical protein L0228_13350 [Planctomycetes bacterium]|nr:hypothetical protein [Planctomycetota bacterium]
MIKRVFLALVAASALAFGAVSPSTATADWDDDDHWDDDWDDDDCHWHHGHHWHHGYHHWRHRPIVYPPVVIGGYYPARYYYGYSPYWSPYGNFGYYGGPYYGFYGSGVRVSVGW